ncbi:MAG TPA: hypothetical protein VEL76_21995 [Gemmataceae bacterium]|nr:hypothetical protein [Gemmataceae bacterium]
MAGAVKLLYHQAAFDLLGEQPVLSLAASQEIENYERRQNTKLPASVREWYSLEAIKGTITDPKDSPLGSLKILLRSFASAQPNRHDHPIPLLDFMADSTACRSAWLLLDNPIDPKISVPSWDGSLDERPFSLFVFELAWNRLTGLRALNVGLLHHQGACSPVQLDLLREHFEEVPRTIAPPSRDLLTGRRDDCCAFHFYDRTARICVSARGAATMRECEASWMISANSEERLSAILRLVWPFVGNPMAFFISDGRDEAAVARVLWRLRKEFGLAPGEHLKKRDKQ